MCQAPARWCYALSATLVSESHLLKLSLWRSVCGLSGVTEGFFSCFPCCWLKDTGELTSISGNLELGICFCQYSFVYRADIIDIVSLLHSKHTVLCFCICLGNYTVGLWLYQVLDNMENPELNVANLADMNRCWVAKHRQGRVCWESLSQLIVFLAFRLAFRAIRTEAAEPQGLLYMCTFGKQEGFKQKHSD